MRCAVEEAAHKDGSVAGFDFSCDAEQILSDNGTVQTVKATLPAGSFASIFRKLIARGEDRTRAQRFILQLLVSVVAEDLGLPLIPEG